MQTNEEGMTHGGYHPTRGYQLKGYRTAPAEAKRKKSMLLIPGAQSSQSRTTKAVYDHTGVIHLLSHQIGSMGLSVSFAIDSLDLGSYHPLHSATAIQKGNSSVIRSNFQIRDHQVIQVQHIFSPGVILIGI